LNISDPNEISPSVNAAVSTAIVTKIISSSSPSSLTNITTTTTTTTTTTISKISEESVCIPFEYKVFPSYPSPSQSTLLYKFINQTTLGSFYDYLPHISVLYSNEKNTIGNYVYDEKHPTLPISKVGDEISSINNNENNDGEINENKVYKLFSSFEDGKNLKPGNDFYPLPQSFSTSLIDLSFFNQFLLHPVRQSFHKFVSSLVSLFIVPTCLLFGLITKNDFSLKSKSFYSSSVLSAFSFASVSSYLSLFLSSIPQAFLNTHYQWLSILARFFFSFIM
jgi:hypothetical protein